jgi:hypothetical protein
VVGRFQVTGWTPERYTTEQFEGLIQPGEVQVAERCGITDAPLLVRVTLHAGAAITAHAAGPVWAHVTRDIEVDAFQGSSHDWLQIGAVAGLISLPEGCSHHQHIWVHSRDVSWAEGT